MAYKDAFADILGGKKEDEEEKAPVMSAGRAAFYRTLEENKPAVSAAPTAGTEEKAPAMSAGRAAFYRVLQEQNEQTPEPASASDYDSLSLPAPKTFTKRAATQPAAGSLALPTPTYTPLVQRMAEENAAMDRERAKYEAVGLPAPGVRKMTPGAAGSGGRGGTTLREKREELDRLRAERNEGSAAYASGDPAEAMAQWERQKETDQRIAELEKELTEKGVDAKDYNGPQTVFENFGAGALSAVRGAANALTYAGQEMTRGQLMEQQSVMSGLPGQQEIADSSGKTLEDMRERGLQSFGQTAETLGAKGLAKLDRGIRDFAQTAAEHAGKAGKVTRAMANVANGVGGMVPSILSNLAVPGSGLWVMAAQAAGNATEEALDAGAQDEKAVLYGGAVAAVEVLTEKMFGGIPGLNIGSLDEGIEKLVKKKVGSEAAQRAVLFLADALGEGAEEFVSEFADWGLNRWLVGSDGRTLREVNKDAWYSALIGSLTSVAMSAPAEAVKGMGPKVLAQEVAAKMDRRLAVEQRAEELKLPDPAKVAAKENAAQGEAAEARYQALRMETPEEVANGGRAEARENVGRGEAAVAETNRRSIIQSIKAKFSSDLANWIQSTTEPDRAKDGGRFLIGHTSENLAKANVDDYDIYFGKSKIAKIMKNPEMTQQVISEVADVIDNPVIVMDSKTVPGSITMFGDSKTDNGKPVMVSMILHPTTKTGEVLDCGIVSSAYGRRRNNAQNLINTSNVRYVDPDTKRTGKWMKALGLQLPSASSVAGIEPPADIKTGVTVQDGVTGAAGASNQTVPQPVQEVNSQPMPTPEGFSYAESENGQTAPDKGAQQAQTQPTQQTAADAADQSLRGEETAEEEMQETPPETPTDPANMPDGGYSANGYAASPGLRKLGVKIAEPITQTIGGDVLLAQAQKAQKATRALDKAIKKLNPTKAERALAMGLADGTYTEGGAVLYGRDGVPIRDVNMNKVRELAEYYKQKNQYKRDRVAEQRRTNRDRETARAEELLEQADNFRKMSALRLNLNTPQRNILAWAGEKLGKAINQHLIKPAEQNSTERIRFVNNMLKRVEGFDLNKAESEMVQRVIEGTAIQDQVSKLTADARRRVNAAATSADFELTAAEYNLTKEERQLAHRYQDWLDTQARLETMDADKINAAAKAYSEAYSDFYTAINEFLVMHGYEPIGFIQGYAPHLQPDNVQSTLGKLLSAFGLDAEVSALPTEIAGRTDTYKPGKQWNPYFQHRAGAKAMVDAVAGYESYVNYMSNVLYHTDDIQKLRIFINQLRGMYATEENRERISQAKELQNKSAEEKETFLVVNHMIEDGSNMTPEDINRRFDEYVDGLYSSIENKSKHGDVASWLEDYTNKLAGKQTKLDRAVESFFGRKAINVGNSLSRTFGMSSVVGSLSSALNQLSQLPAVQAEVGNKYVLRAVRDILRGEGTALDDASDFLTGKRGTDSLLARRSWADSDSRQRMDKVTRAMSIPFEAVDTLASRIYVRAKYLQEIENGATHEQAVKSADEFTEKIVGNRIQGSRPMVFESKNAMVKLFSTFQLEVANAWAHIRQDLPAEIKAIEQEKGKTAAVQRTAEILMRYGISAFLMNRLTEALYGGTPAPFDLIGYILGGVAAGKGETTNDYLIGLVRDLFGLGDDEDDEEDKEFDVGAALKETGSLMVGDVPYVRNAASMLGYGDTNLPLPSVGKTAGSLWDLIRGSGSWKDLGESALKDAATWLPGGNQAKKTVQGIETIAKQGRYNKRGNLMYPVDMSGPQGIAKGAKAALFGPSSLGATDAYYASGDKALSEKQTATYEYLTGIGEDRNEVYDTIMRFRKVKDVKDSDEDGKARRDILRSAELDDYSKARLYETLFNKEGGYEELAGLMDRGLSFDDCMDVLDKYNELKNTDEKPGVQASRFAQWVDGRFKPEDAEAIQGEYKFWQNIPAEPKAYEKAASADTDIETAAEAMEVYNKAEGKKNADGETIDGTKKAEIFRGVDSLDTDQGTKLKLLESYGYNTDGYGKVRLFMSLSDYADALELQAMATGTKDDKGQTVDGSKALEVMQGVDKMTLSAREKSRVMGALGYTFDGENKAPPIWETKYSGKDYEAYYYMSDSRREKYNTFCDWMTPADYAKYADSISEMHSIYGSDGKEQVSRKAQVIEYINALDLLPDQKTALYVAMGYNENMTDKGFRECPWWNALHLRTQYYPKK